MKKPQIYTSSEGPRVRKAEKAQETYTWGHPRRGDLEWRRKNQKVQKALPRDDDLEYRRIFLFLLCAKRGENFKSFDKQQTNREKQKTFYFRAKRGEKMIFYFARSADQI